MALLGFDDRLLGGDFVTGHVAADRLWVRRWGTYNVIAEDDLYLAVGDAARYGLEAGLLGGLGLAARYVTFEPAHEEQQSHDQQRPEDQYAQKKQLVGRHLEQCRRA